MARRREIIVHSPDAGSSSGIAVSINRKGIEVYGWYDHICKVDDPLVISWDVLDRLRAKVNKTKKAVEEEVG